jgi:hypothetical protein
MCEQSRKRAEKREEPIASRADELVLYRKAFSNETEIPYGGFMKRTDGT